jgi:hypothetical protein
MALDEITACAEGADWGVRPGPAGVQAGVARPGVRGWSALAKGVPPGRAGVWAAGARLGAWAARVDWVAPPGRAGVWAAGARLAAWAARVVWAEQPEPASALGEAA